jgi:hypothetical protein
MHKAYAIWSGVLLSLCVCAPALADPLPKSGSISYHTAWKDTGAAIEVADKRMQGQGMVTGATFNDKGSGPLQGGPANCSYTFMAVEGAGKSKGYCTFGDADGDRIFTDFTGDNMPDGQASGTNEIVGGTGKYAGIKGSGPWKCRYVGRNGESHCTQRLDYRLP